jgi:hypothetical protein
LLTPAASELLAGIRSLTHAAEVLTDNRSLARRLGSAAGNRSFIHARPRC